MNIVGPGNTTPLSLPQRSIESPALPHNGLLIHRPQTAGQVGPATVFRGMVTYGWRHLVENFFAKIKEFRAIATRYDKTDESFAAGIHLVAGVVAAK